MRTKSNSLKEFSSQASYDIFVIVETWLNDDFFNSEFFDDKLYNVYRKDRSSVRTGLERGGGVLVAVKKEFNSYISPVLVVDELLDQLVIVIPLQRYPVCLCASYIPPTGGYDLYSAHVNNILTLYEKMASGTRFVILGDFNLNEIKWVQSDTHLVPSNVNHDYEINLVDSFLSLDLLQINNLYNKLHKILDLIFVPSDSKINLYECLDPFSPNTIHHIATVLELDVYSYLKISNSTFSKFDYKKCDFDALNSALLSIDWNSLFQNQTVNSSYEIFLDEVLHICRQHIPLKNNMANSHPWYTRGLKVLKNKRNKLHKCYLSSGSPETLSQYRQCTREFNFLNKFLYKQYIIRVESDIKSNPKSFWSFIRSKKRHMDIPSCMMYNNSFSDDPSKIVNFFADYFKSNFDATASNVHLDFQITSNINLGQIFLSKNDILDAINSLNNSYARDADGLSVYLVKRCALSLAYPILSIFNKSLVEGIFIDRWKLTYINPIFKSGARNDICNYRSISKLTAISKIFEYAILKILYFHTKSYIIPQQHGFRSCKSTISNLTVFTDFCFSQLEDGAQVDVIYTDFSKAFDKISHVLLLRKLFDLGIHSSLHNWLTSYLSNRVCVVQIDVLSSTPYVQTSGVPQGSVLGPLLFNLFINDISKCFSYANFLLYADDLKIYSRVDTVVDAIRLQSDLDSLGRWCENNHLKFNYGKCVHISYSRLRNPLVTSYYINDDIINQDQVIEDLGILFDSKLTFMPHLDKIIPKAYSTLAFIKRSCNEFKDPYTLKTLYSAYVRSKLEYGALIWSPHCFTHTARIERIQRRFIRYALPHLNLIVPRPSYNSRCLHLGMISLEKRRQLHSMMFIYDLLNDNIDCPELLNKIPLCVPGRLLLRHRILFYIPLHRRNYTLNGPLTRSLIHLNSINEKSNVEFNASKICFKSFLLNNL